MNSARRRIAIASACSFVVLSSAFAMGDPPDLELNPLTGHVESVDLSSGDGERVRHVIDPGQGGSRTSQLVSAAVGIAPRIAIKSTGESWVVWGEHGSPDRLRYVYRNPATGGFSAEAALGSPSEISQHPEIVHNGSATWVAYEIVAGSSKSIAVTGITDSPEPFPERTIIATTTFSGAVDVLIHAESNHVWATWIDSSTHVGWSEYQAATGLWTLPQYQAYPPASPDSARKGIRTIIVGS